MVTSQNVPGFCVMLPLLLCGWLPASQRSTWAGTTSRLLDDRCRNCGLISIISGHPMNHAEPVFSLGEQLSTHRAIFAKVKQFASFADKLQNIEPTLVQVRTDSKPACRPYYLLNTASYCESLSAHSAAQKIQSGWGTFCAYGFCERKSRFHYRWCPRNRRRSRPPTACQGRQARPD